MEDLCDYCVFSNGEDCALHFAPEELINECMKEGHVMVCRGVFQ